MDLEMLEASAKMHKKLIIFLVILFIILIGFALIKKKTHTEQIQNYKVISSAIAEVDDWKVFIETSGPVIASQEAIISCQLTGQRLIELSVNVGDEVRKDQILAKFDTDILNVELAQLEALYKLAKSNADRVQSLRGSGALSNQEIETYISQAEVALANLNIKKLSLDYAIVKSPGDGIVNSRAASLGAVPNYGMELFRIILDNKLEWRGELSSAQLTLVKPGQIIELKLSDGGTASAKVRQVSPSLDINSRMAIVYADIDVNTKAKAGMYLSGVINLSISRAIVVPTQAVIIKDGNSYVFRLVSEGDSSKVAMQKVITGRSKDAKIEIIEGIKENQEIAGQGAGFLLDGDLVQVTNKITKPKQG